MHLEECCVALYTCRYIGWCAAQELQSLQQLVIALVDILLGLCSWKSSTEVVSAQS